VKSKTSWLYQLLNVIMAAALFFMAILVFGNVVLRYVFNSGIYWSEEIARFLFIWMIFLGAIGALKNNQHLGVDTLLKIVPRFMKKIMYVTSNVLVLYILWLVLDGSWNMVQINKENPAPATGLPMSYVYAVGLVTSVAMGIILLFNLYRVFSDIEAIDEFTSMRESEEEINETVHDEQQMNLRG
jgi:TRAP-type C4-dicarboxylate transport system permease small subunit